MGMLSMDINQFFTQLSEGCKRHWCVVDKGAGAPFDSEYPAHQAVAGVIQQLLLVQPLFRLTAVSEIKSRSNLGFFMAAADQADVSLVAQHQPERVDQDGFACTGFTGESAHA